MEIELRDNGNEYSAIILTIQIIGKPRSHLYFHLISISSYLISYSFYVSPFNNPSKDFFWPWFPMYSILLYSNANKQALK